MKSAVILSCIAAANAAAIDLAKRDSPLAVKIEQVGNSGMKASITNTGDAALRVLKPGSILGSLPVEKVKVTQNAKKVNFTGIHAYVHDADLKDESFQTIGAQETVEVSWDAAQWHDLSAGGAFDITAEGSLRYSEEGSERITGSVVYKSNLVQAKVNGVQAAEVHSAQKAQMAKRATVQSDCTGTKKTAVDAALNVAKTYATQASAAATAGTKLQEYFKSTTSSTKTTVAGVFNSVASSVVNSDSSGVKLYCSDVGNYCSDGVVAYTQPGITASEYIVLCDYWFLFPATTKECHAADQPYVIIHESTHLSEIKGTDDVCYGYDGCVTDISSSQELNNADSYALYANAIEAGC